MTDRILKELLSQSNAETLNRFDTEHKAQP